MNAIQRIDLRKAAGLTSKCKFPPFGWYCKIGVSHLGPCPAIPRWWNLKRRTPRRRWL